MSANMTCIWVALVVNVCECRSDLPTWSDMERLGYDGTPILWITSQRAGTIT